MPILPAAADQEPASSGDLVRRATNLLARVAVSPGDPLNPSDTRVAESWLDQATRDLPAEMAEVGIGSELIPFGQEGNARVLRNTIDSPTYVTAGASRARIELASQTGSLELGLDLADTIQAGNSLEKMLAHQLAAAHASSMRLTAQLNECTERMQSCSYDRAGDEKRDRANIQATRLAGAVARMNGSFQHGLLTLQRMRSGGRQVVTVKHVHQQVQINEGGQAMVAGQLESVAGEESGGTARNDR